MYVVFSSFALSFVGHCMCNFIYDFLPYSFSNCVGRYLKKNTSYGNAKHFYCVLLLKCFLELSIQLVCRFHGILNVHIHLF